MSISGFDQSECCGLKRLLRALGITLVPMFTRRSTVLLCPSGTGLKYEKAQEWSVPVVGLEWLKEMATTGEIPEVEKHVVKRCASSIHIGIVANNEEDGRVVDVAEQGKGKATSVGMDDAMGMDVDLQMHDVTTSELPPRSRWGKRRTQGNFLLQIRQERQWNARPLLLYPTQNLQNDCDLWLASQMRQ